MEVHNTITTHIVTLTINNNRGKKLRVFVCDDYEFLCKLYGLSGASGIIIQDQSYQKHGFTFSSLTHRSALILLLVVPHNPGATDFVT